MGNVIQLPIANGFYVSDSLPISAQRCVNWQPNIPQAPSMTDANLSPTPGLVELARASNIDACRGVHVLGETPYFVIGQKLYRLNLQENGETELFTTEELGDIVGDSRVTMADNGTELCICARPDDLTTGKSYIFTEDPDILTEITDANFDGPATSVVYLDGFFVFTRADGKKFFNSPLASGLGPYDALDFSTASADPDQIRAQASLGGQLYMFGSETTEIFRNVGRSPAPFVRVQGAVLDVGIFSPLSLLIYASALVFVGGSTNQSPAVWAISGGSKKRISTTAIDNELAKLSADELAEVFAWSYAESGANLYGLTLPHTTFVYDSVNQRWHERQTTSNGELFQYRVSHMVTAYGRILVGDLQDGRIGQLDASVYTDYNRLVQRFATTQPFDNQGRPVFVSKIEAVCEAGVGLANDVSVESGTTVRGEPISVMTGSDPKITLAWSDNGGRTFTGYLSRSLGKMGEYKRRQLWRKLGRFSRARVVRFEISAPVKAVLIRAEAEVRG